MAKANWIASKFLIQVLDQTKLRVLRQMERLTEAYQAQDESLINDVLDRIGMSCVLGDVIGTLSARQYSWIRDVANQEHLVSRPQCRIVSYEGHEVGFWSYSWPDAPQTTIHYILDPTVVQAYLNIPSDVLARAMARCREDSDGGPVNHWMLHIAGVFV